MRKIRRELRGSMRVLSTVLANRDLRRVELAFLGFNVAEQGTWIAILVFAYEAGGATAAGVVVVIQLVPATVFAPFAATLGDRYTRERVLVLGYLVQAVSMGATAAAMLLKAPVPVVYGLAACAATSVTMTRPIQGAILPSLSRTPEELTAANVVLGAMESVGLLVGPALTGVLLLWGAGVVFAAMAGVALASMVLAALIRSRTVPPGAESERGIGMVRSGIEGIRRLVSDPDCRALVILIAGEDVQFGAIDVLIVVLAIAVLGMGRSGAGYLNSALGFGGLIGSAATVVLVGRRRLAPLVAAGFVGFGLGFALIGVFPYTAAAFVLFGMLNGSRNFGNVGGRTLLQRIAPDEILSRTFGVLEGLSMAALAVGGVAAAALVAWVGPRAAFIGTGMFMPVLVVLLWRRLRRADAQSRIPGPELPLLRSIPMFAPLPPQTIEPIAARLVPVEALPGNVIIRQGDVGDRFYVIASGEVDVSIDGKTVSTAGPGGHFGEIALLRDVPRSATVTAQTPVRLYALEREDFLEAITGHVQSLKEAESVIRTRLAGRET